MKHSFRRASCLVVGESFLRRNDQPGYYLLSAARCRWKPHLGQDGQSLSLIEPMLEIADNPLLKQRMQIPNSDNN